MPDSISSISVGEPLVLPDASVISQRFGAREILKPPADVQKRILDRGGLNRHGEPNFRLIWGWSRKELLWSRQIGGFDRRPKYFRQKNRWVVEAWHPPYIAPEDWETTTYDWIDGQRIPLLGPYMSRGDYEYLWHAETPHNANCEISEITRGSDGTCVCGGGGYVALTPSVVDVLLDMVAASRMLLAATRRHWYLEQQEKKERDFDNLASDAIDNAGTPFGGNYFVPMRGSLANYRPKNWLNRKI